MIRSIPNPPMDRDDVARFHRNLEKHLREEFNEEERRQNAECQAQMEAVAKQIIANCGGRNPLLSY